MRAHDTGGAALPNWYLGDALALRIEDRGDRRGRERQSQTVISTLP